MILVADQKRTVADMLARRLQAEGWGTVVASDGAGVARALAEGNIRLAIIDPALTGSGIAVLLKLRADPTTAKIPVILFGSLDSPQEREAARHAGADAFLVKGRVTPNQLLERVSSLAGAPPPLVPTVTALAPPALRTREDYAIAIQPGLGDVRRLARSRGLRDDLHCIACGRPVILRLSSDESWSAWTLGCSACTGTTGRPATDRIPSMAESAP